MKQLFEFINRIDDIPYSFILAKQYNYKVAIFLGYIIKQMLINQSETVTISNYELGEAVNMTASDISKCRAVLSNCNFIVTDKYSKNNDTTYKINIDKLNVFLNNNQ